MYEVSYCRNQKRSKVDQEAIELIAAQQDVDERGSGNDPHSTDVAESNFCEEDEDKEDKDRAGDDTKLLSSDEESSITAANLTSMEAAKGGTSSGHRQEEGEEGGEEMMVEEPSVTLLTPTLKKRNKCLSKFFSALKNLFLDLRLFFWLLATLKDIIIPVH